MKLKKLNPTRSGIRFQINMQKILRSQLKVKNAFLAGV